MRGIFENQSVVHGSFKDSVQADFTLFQQGIGIFLIDVVIKIDNIGGKNIGEGSFSESGNEIPQNG